MAKRRQHRFPTKVDDDPRTPAFLVRPAREVSFGIALPICRGAPPLRVFRQELLDAQLQVNCAHLLAEGLQIDAGRRRVVLPGLLAWYRADFGSSDSALLEFIIGALRATAKAVEKLLDAATPADLALPSTASRLAEELEVLRRPHGTSGVESFPGVTVEPAELDWSFAVPRLQGAT